MKIGSFYEDWAIDFATLEIKRKHFSIRQRLVNWNKKYRLSEFHGWARDNEASSTGIAYPHILDSDAMQPVKGVPKKLEIVNGWSIKQTDLKLIVGDGYVLIENGKLLTPERTNRILDSFEAKPGICGFSIDLKRLFRFDK